MDVATSIGLAGAIAIAKVLPSSNIHYLELSGMHVETERVISEFIRIGNDIGSKGAEAIAESLPSSKLHTLYLNGTILSISKKANVILI